MSLLHGLSDVLFPPREHERSVRALSVATLGTCSEPTEVYPHMFATLPYDHASVAACIQEAKFHKNERAEQILASLFADFLCEWMYECSGLNHSPLVFVPVPLSREREKERGYSQTGRLMKNTKLHVPSMRVDTEILIRVQHTPPQTSLGKAARAINMQGAFSVARTPNPNHTYIVCDDVVTTGATMRACMETLSKAGARRVLGLALAHAR